jgi:hypothetical protein
MAGTVTPPLVLRPAAAVCGVNREPRCVGGVIGTPARFPGSLLALLVFVVVGRVGAIASVIIVRPAGGATGQHRCQQGAASMKVHSVFIVLL